MDPLLHKALRGLAGRRPLLVGLDFDGVLAPFVRAPVGRRRHCPARWTRSVHVLALHGVSRRPGVRAGARRPVAAHRRGGRRRAADPGRQPRRRAAAGPGRERRLTSPSAQRLAAVQAAVGSPGRRAPRRATSSTSPAPPSCTPGGCPHRRGRDGDRARAVGDGGGAGVHVTRGKEVVEVAVTEASKGAAIGRLRDHLGAAAVLYLGDDVTDETVFAVLGPATSGSRSETARPLRGTGSPTRPPSASCCAPCPPSSPPRWPQLITPWANPCDHVNAGGGEQAGQRTSAATRARRRSSRARRARAGTRTRRAARAGR